MLNTLWQRNIRSINKRIKTRRENKMTNKPTITSWSINVKWSNGLEENLTDCDDDTASYVDQYLTEVEQQKQSEE